MADKQEKRKGRGGRRAVGAAVLLLLLAGGGYSTRGFGLLPGDGDSVLPQAEQTVVAEQAETEAAAESNELIIRVHESEIRFQGEAVTAEQLEEALLHSYGEGKTVRLIDDGAIKADYDTAVAVLEKLNIPYTAE